jgi:hypothetical protein
MRLVSALALLALLLASGCGNEHTDRGKSLPECSDVWVAGRTLPDDYRGCRESGAVVRPDLINCPDSDQVAVKFGDEYIGVLGSEIVGGDPSTTTVVNC